MSLEFPPVVIWLRLRRGRRAVVILRSVAP